MLDFEPEDWVGCANSYGRLCVVNWNFYLKVEGVKKTDSLADSNFYLEVVKVEGVEKTDGLVDSIAFGAENVAGAGEVGDIEGAANYGAASHDKEDMNCEACYARKRVEEGLEAVHTAFVEVVALEVGGHSGIAIAIAG